MIVLAFLALLALAKPAIDCLRIASSLKTYTPSLPTLVVDRNGAPIGEFYEQRRRLIALDELPKYVVQAFLAGEDADFYEHSGVDVAAVTRAGWANLRGGKIVQGGSTITQQLAKMMFLSPERTVRRKLKDMALALAIELRLSKTEILTTYLNEVYLGAGAYGLGAAAEVYFDKPASALTLSEAALLAGLPKAPSRLSPLVNANGAEQRRRYVLAQMQSLGWLDADAARDALDDRPVLHAPHAPESFETAAWFVEEVRRSLIARLGTATVLRGGLRVETTLDLALQRDATTAVRAGLQAVERRRGSNDATIPASEGALIAMTPGTGDVLALVGGYDRRRSRFNRATQAHRQPGSAFKAFVYGAALEAGYPAYATLYDYQAHYRGAAGGWEPRNHDGRFRGEISMHEAFARSLNNASVRLSDEVGVGKVADFARRAGIRSKLDANLSLALGSSEVTLLELTAAYGTFASGGRSVEPRLIERVLARDGSVVADDMRALPPSRDATGISAVDAYLVTHLLRETVRAWYGTGHRAASIGEALAAKTGSTNENRDAWFVGFSPSVVTGVWVGNDDRSPLGPRETGSRAALPIWTQFMRAAIAAHPAAPAEPPPGIVFTNFDEMTGERLTSERPIAGWIPAAGDRKVRYAKHVGPPEPVDAPVAVIVPVYGELFGDDPDVRPQQRDDSRGAPPRAAIIEPAQGEVPQGHGLRRPWQARGRVRGDASSSAAGEPSGLN